MALTHSYYSEPKPQRAGFRLIPLQFEELELFPGVICAGTAHFDTDRFGGWSVEHIELDGWHSPGSYLDDSSIGDAGVIFKLICKVLRDREDEILGNNSRED